MEPSQVFIEKNLSRNGLQNALKRKSPLQVNLISKTSWEIQSKSETGILQDFHLTEFQLRMVSLPLKERGGL